MKTIEMTLSTESIDKAIKELKEYQNDIIERTELLARKVAEIGVTIAKANVTEYDALYTGELLASIQSEYGEKTEDGATWLVVTNCKWAAYVEFGTGLKGMNKPHPESNIVGWKYDTNDHGVAGWYYFKDGKWYWTQGMMSRPFMYETSITMRSKVEKIAKEIFDV